MTVIQTQYYLQLGISGVLETGNIVTVLQLMQMTINIWASMMQPSRACQASSC